ncbi:MAG: hypothetical protein ACQER9_00840 [Nanobdellota archaeon]
MMTYKKTLIGMGIDAIAVALSALILYLHNLLIKSTKAYKFIKDFSQAELLQDPSKLPKENIMLISSIQMILATIIALVLIYFIFVYSRKYIYKLITQKKIDKVQRTIWAGIFLVYIPLIIILLITTGIINLIFSIFPQNIFILYIHQIILSVIFIKFFYFITMYHASGFHEKKLLKSYEKIFNKIKKNKNQIGKHILMITIIVAVLYAIQLLLFNFIANNIFQIIWYWFIFLLSISLIRVKAIECA